SFCDSNNGGCCRVLGDVRNPYGIFSCVIVLIVFSSAPAYADVVETVGRSPSPSGRRWPEAPGEGRLEPSPAASRHPSPRGRGILPKQVWNFGKPHIAPLALRQEARKHRTQT